MRVIILALLCFVAGIAFAQQAISETEAESLFALFLAQHNKAYGANLDAYKAKFAIFKDNLAYVQQLNARQNSSAIYAVTKYMDMTRTEFKNTMLSKINMRRPENPSSEGYSLVKDYPTNDLPASWNWNDKGAVTGVKDQGACGSCWAFSTTGNVEGQWFLAKGSLVSLSEQQLVDCDKECDPEDPQSCDAGCDGGLMMNALTYIIKNKGITSEKNYPYRAEDHKCKKGVTPVATIDDKKLLSKDESEIQQYLYANGPLAVALNADDLQFYSRGIINDPDCDPDALDHGVLLVGYGTENGKNYWIVKNSWGTGWGESGFFRMSRGNGMCGINTYVCTAIINKN